MVGVEEHLFFVFVANIDQGRSAHLCSMSTSAHPAVKVVGRHLALVLPVHAGSLGTVLASSPAPQTQHEVNRRLLVDVIVGQGTGVVELLARKDQALLVRWDALAVLNECLDTGHGVPLRVDVERQVSPSQCL